MISKTTFAVLAVVLPSLVVAQSSPIYGQCGGIGWTGPTTCVSGSSCSELNAYYSQCLPGTASTTTTSSSTGSTGSTTTSSVTSTGTPNAGNPFLGKTVFLSPPYTAEVQAAVASISDATLAAQAATVADIPTFIWFDQVAKVPNLTTYLAAAQKQGPDVLVPIVIYDLPDRDCAADASNGEFTFADNGTALYENYIDQIVAAIKEYPDVPVVAVIEPDSLANLVTNLSVEKCSEAETGYITCITYAIQQLSAVGVSMYLDAGHAGWLGWPANLSPAAQLFGSLYSNAGSPKGVRGLATDVANYNSYTTNSPDPITQGDPNYDELLYVQALAPLLQQSGFPANFIIDQSRSGVQDIRNAWGDWCNVKGAGFGIRPTTDTNSSLVDAIVWVKPGGECDGTSNTSAPRYDPHCSLSDALQPAPEAGTWFQTFFEDLVSGANPPL